jgi:Transposase
MPDKPDYVVRFKKPVNTEIKKIGEHYYLYSRKSVYDPKTQRMRKKSGKVLGKITADGFVESNARKAERNPNEETMIDWGEVVNVEFGASYYLYDNNRDILDRLKMHFPSCWKELFSMAAARCLGETAFRRFDTDYYTSILPHYLGNDLNLDVVRNAKNGLIEKIGSMRKSITDYMSEDLNSNDRLILIDGHRLISVSETLSDAQLGYDSRRRNKPQVNILYIFSLSEQEGMPAFYKEFAGSVPDCTALPMLLEETSIDAKFLTAVTDKGFSSEEGFEAIADTGMHYILAVRRGCSAVSVPEGISGYSDVFTFRERSVYYKSFVEGERVYHLYYDMSLANAETTDLVLRSQKRNNAKEYRIEMEECKRRNRKKPKLTDVELAALKNSLFSPIEDILDKKSIGTFILCTDRKELKATEVYEIYKRRQEIEQSFKGYDDVLGCTASYMRSHEGIECWLFINHLALQMEYRLLNKIAALGLTARYSFRDAVKFLSSIRANKIKDKWYVSAITGKTRKFCEDIGFKYPLSMNAEP